MPQPLQLDFVDLADGVERNNVGCDAITLGVRARIDGANAVMPSTGQRLPVTGVGDATGGAWQWFAVERFGKGEQPRLRWLRASASPTFDAGAAAPPAVK